MLPSSSAELVRIALFSGFIGFVAFCLSYAAQVWAKRNKGNTPISWTKRIATGMITGGIMFIAATWLLNGYVHRDGVVNGDDLFVVRARADGDVKLNIADHVQRGDLLAEYRPPQIAAQISVIESQIKEGQARVEAADLRPVEIDPDLLQRKAQLQAQLNQQLQFQFDFARSRRELEIGAMSSMARLDAEQSQFHNDLATQRAALDGVPARMELANIGLGRALELRKHALVSAQHVDDRTSAVLNIALDRERLASTISGLSERILQLDAQKSRESTEFSNQMATVAHDADSARQVAAQLTQKIGALDNQIDADRQRAAVVKSSERYLVRQQLATLIAERDRTLASVQIRAPSDGRIVYRATSPGLAQAGTPVLAMSSRAGFEARVLMPIAEANAVANAGEVKFRLDQPVFEKFIAATFRSADAAPFEPGYAVARFDARLPVDAIDQLASSHQPISASLQWHQPLFATSGARIGLVLAILGLLVMLRRTAAQYLAGLFARPTTSPAFSSDLHAVEHDRIVRFPPSQNQPAQSFDDPIIRPAPSYARSEQA